MDDRAVSEVMGFVLVFGLVLGTISLVYVSGIAGLDDTRDSERLQNAERAFDVLADNFKALGRGDAPNRATEIRLADSQLSMEQRYRTRFVHDGNSIAVAAPRPIVFDGGTNVQIVYEQGAVIRVDEESARMLREPDYLFSEGRTVIRVIEPRGGVQSVGGTTTALVRAERNQPTLEFGDEVSGDLEVRLNTTTDRATVWREFLQRQQAVDETTCEITEAPDEPSLATVECELDTDELYVTRTLIDVELT